MNDVDTVRKLLEPPRFSWAFNLAAALAVFMSVWMCMSREYKWGAALLSINTAAYLRVRSSYRRACISHACFASAFRAHVFAEAWGAYCRRLHGDK